MKLACVVGTRPQIIKAAALWPALRRNHEPRLIDTGQHYDDEMAGNFFGELRLPPPDHQLGVGSGSHARQTAAMMDRLEPLVLDERPDAVVVFGDTNSTLAGGLVAAKLGIPLAHVEAGLRSFDRRMPEEINRVVVDHLSQLLFAPNEGARANLAAEGIGAGGTGSIVRGAVAADAVAAGAVGLGAVAAGALARPAGAAPGSETGEPARVEVVGDLMQDLCAAAVDDVRDPARIGSLAPEPVAQLGLRTGEYLLATVHRAENRPRDAVRAWTSLLAAVAAETRRPIVLALHPGTRTALDEHGIALPGAVRDVSPQGYRTTLALQLHAAAILTDSGGVQREAAWLGVPALVLRETTEWPETLESNGGRSALVGRDIARALAALSRLVPADGAEAARVRARTAIVPPAGAAELISASLAAWPRTA